MSILVDSACNEHNEPFYRLFSSQRYGMSTHASRGKSAVTIPMCEVLATSCVCPSIEGSPAGCFHPWPQFVGVAILGTGVLQNLMFQQHILAFLTSSDHVCYNAIFCTGHPNTCTAHLSISVNCSVSAPTKFTNLFSEVILKSSHTIRPKLHQLGFHPDFEPEYLGPWGAISTLHGRMSFYEC